MTSQCMLTFPELLTMCWHILNKDLDELTRETAIPVKVLIKGHWSLYAYAYLKECEAVAHVYSYTVEMVDNEDSAHLVVTLRNELAYDFGMEEDIRDQDGVWVGAVVAGFEANSHIRDHLLRDGSRTYTFEQITPEYLSLANPYPKGLAGLVQLYKDLLRDAIERRKPPRLTKDILVHEWSLLGSHPRVNNFKNVLPKEVQRALIASLLEELRFQRRTLGQMKSRHGEIFIRTNGFDGLFLRLASEVNDAFDCGCHVATAVLTRKLLEALLVSIMQKRYASSHPEYFLRGRKQVSFEQTLLRFWKNFPLDFLQFSPTRNEERLTAVKENLKRLKDGLNVDVHEIGSMTDRQSLLDTRSQIQGVLDFLQYVEQRVTSESP